MTSETWDSVDRNVVRINHVLAKITFATVEPSVTADAVFPSQIDATSFLKYVSVHLIDKSQILNFYQNFAAQATRHNVFNRPHADITVDKGVIPDGMLPEFRTTTATALYTKFCQSGTISSSYTDALNLFAITINGFEFLQILLQ